MPAVDEGFGLGVAVECAAADCRAEKEAGGEPGSRAAQAGGGDGAGADGGCGWEQPAHFRVETSWRRGIGAGVESSRTLFALAQVPIMKILAR